MKPYAEIRKELKHLKSFYLEEAQQHCYSGQQLRLEKLSSVAGILSKGLPPRGYSENGSAIVDLSMEQVIASLKRKRHGSPYRTKTGLSEVSVSGYVRTVSNKLGLELVLAE